MRIGIVTPVFHPYPGGVPEHVYHEYLELRRRGHEARVVTTHFGSGESPVEENVIRIGRTVSIPANGSMCPVAFHPSMRSMLRDTFEREGFDVLHVHEPLMPFLCLSAIDVSRVPTVGTFHASNESGLGYKMFGPVLARRFARLDRRICVSKAAMETVRPHFGGTYDLIPNGVDVERFSSAEPLDETLDESFDILFVGRMEPRKGAKYLLRAMPGILRKVPSARLTVVGSGPLTGHYRSYLDEACADRVRFAGRVSGEILARHFASADVYCSPATGGESFGIVLLEAMAAGAAIIASDIPGYRDVVEHGRTGILVEPRSPEAIADAVVRLHSDPALARRLVEGARQEVRRYAWSRVAGEILDVLVEAARSGPRGSGGDARIGVEQRDMVETSVGE